MNMVLDPIREKTMESLSVISGNENRAELQKKLEEFSVQIIFPESFQNNKNAVICCEMILNLLPRFINIVAYDGPETVALKFLPSHQKKILFAKIQNPSLVIVLGNQEYNHDQNVLYVGSVGWSIYISTKKPCTWNSLPINPLSSLYAAGLAVGEVFKHLLPNKQIKKINNLEYDLINHDPTILQPVCEPPIPNIIHFDKFAIIGCGAIGQSIAYALNKTSKLFGTMILFDNESLEPSNEQRYVYAYAETRNIQKTKILSDILTRDNNTSLRITSAGKYEQFTDIQIPIDEAVTCVDNIETRINVQASLPKILWNVWTDTAKNTLRYGAGKHMISGPYHCVACAYHVPGKSPNNNQMNMLRTGFTEDEIKEKSRPEYRVTGQDIMKINQNTGIVRNELNQNIGKPFNELLHGQCGVYSIFGKSHEPTPAPHVPLLAGVFLASQIILRKLQLTDPSRLMESTVAFDLFDYPNSVFFEKNKKIQTCFCKDIIYQNIYNKKWNN